MFETKNVFYPYQVLSQDPNIQKRLAFLESINLAKRFNKTYFLTNDWYETLQTTERYNMFLNVRNEYAVKNKPVHFFKNTEDIKGTVLKVFTMDDETVWQNALVVETGNAIYYVPSYKKVKTKAGDSVEVKINKQGQTNISIQQSAHDIKKTKTFTRT